MNFIVLKPHFFECMSGIGQTYRG